MVTSTTSVVRQPLTLDHVGSRRTLPTPRCLRALSIALAVGVVGAGVTGGLAVLARQRATERAISTAQPLALDAVTLDVTLSDANTTIAGGFLGAPPVPVSVESQYERDLATSAAALTAAAQQSGGDSEAARQLAILSTGVPLYSATVATAESDYREGFPVATAYLSEANYLMRNRLLPAAATLDGVERVRLARDNADAARAGLVAVAMGLLAAVLVLAIWTQLRVSRRFRRLINVGLAVTTVLVIVVGAWTLVATESASRSMKSAERRGTAPLTTLTQARILAQQARADDELTLVTRDADPSFGQDFNKSDGSLKALLVGDHPGWTSAEARDLARASGAWNAYDQAHSQSLALQSADQLSQTAAVDSSGAQAAANVDAALTNGVTESVRAFDSNARAASSDLGGLALAGLILTILAAMAAIAGLEPRIREYR
jgi:hypothetical protein